MVDMYGLKTLEKRIHLDTPVNWTYFSQHDGHPMGGTLVTLASRQALFETHAPVPEGRWIRLRLTIDRSFEVLVVGRVARASFKGANHRYLHEIDLTHAVNPVVLALLELRTRMQARMRQQNNQQQFSPSLTPA